METIAIRPAAPEDAGRLNEALARLSADLGDPHRATEADLARHGFGTVPVFRACLAESGEAVVGAVVFSPFFSTIRGAPGAYVSDLWVSEAARGSGLGARLLAAARDAAGREWGARSLKLAVYRDNPRARAFYLRLGFAPSGDEEYLMLGGAALAALGDHG